MTWPLRRRTSGRGGSPWPSRPHGPKPAHRRSQLVGTLCSTARFGRPEGPVRGKPFASATHRRIEHDPTRRYPAAQGNYGRMVARSRRNRFDSIWNRFVFEPIYRSAGFGFVDWRVRLCVWNSPDCAWLPYAPSGRDPWRYQAAGSLRKIVSSLATAGLSDAILSHHSGRRNFSHSH